MDQVVHNASLPYLERGSGPCDIVADINVYPIKFEGSTQAMITSSDPLVNAKIIDTDLLLSQNIGAITSQKVVAIAADKSYHLTVNDKCGNPVVVKEFSDKAIGDATIKVSRAAFKAVMEWQKTANDTKESLTDFLRDNKDISVPEKLYVLQQTVHKGRPFSNQLLQSIPLGNRPWIWTWTWGPNGPIVGPPIGPRNSHCDCNVIEINISQNAVPNSGTRTNSQGGSEINGLYGGSSREDFANDRIKVWKAYAFEGPSRYMELWGLTKPGKCIAAPYRFGWNDVEDTASELPDELAPSFTAELSYNMLCTNGDNLPDDSCGCEREIQYRVAYNSLVRAEGEYNDTRNPFCLNDHWVEATAEDFVIVSAGDESMDGSFEVIAAMANAQVRRGEYDWDPPSIAEVVRLGAYAFLMVKGIQGGGLGFDSGSQLIDASVDLAYSQYLNANTSNALTAVFDEPWWDYYGLLGGDLEGRNRHLAGSVNGLRGTITLKPNDPHRIVLASSSRLTVSGQRRWNASARVLTSYSLTGILRGQTNAGTTFRDHCCTPPIATYTMAAISGDVASSGVTETSWWGSIAAFLNDWGLEDVNVNGGVAVVIGEYPEDCETDINIFSPRLRNTEADEAFTTIFINDIEPVNLQREEGVTEVLRVISANGQLVYNQTLPPAATSIAIPMTNYPPGIYFASLLRNDGSVFTTKFVHRR